MTESDSNRRGSTAVLRALILIVVASALCLAVMALLDSTGEFDFSVLVSNKLLVPALVLQLVGLGLFVCAWHLLLRSTDSTSMPVLESAAQVGVTLLGKYLPGKIWGMLGRGYLLSRRGVLASSAASLLLADQFLTFYSGLGIGITALLVVYNPVIGLLALVIGTITIPVVLRANFSIIQWIAGKAGRLFRHLDSDASSPSLKFRARALALPFLVYVLHWLAISLVLVLLFRPILQEQLFHNVLLLISAIPLAMLAGFVALWAPGGIGVREAVIVAVLSLNLDLQVAGSIAITYRLLCVLNDLIMGSLAIAYYGRDQVLSR